jgi:hypothetical protein
MRAADRYHDCILQQCGKTNSLHQKHLHQKHSPGEPKV